MARSKKSGAASLWIWALLLGGGLLAYRYQQKGTLIDGAGTAGRINAAADDALAAQGVKDSQIVKCLRVERKKTFPFPKSWIETERHFSGVPIRSVDKIYANLKKSSQDLKLDRISRDGGSDRTVIELGRDRAIYQRLVFLRADRSKNPKVAIVIDDVAGRPGDLVRLDAYFALGIPLTFALMPMERDTSAAAERIHRAGHEIILHQPMEPQNAKGNPPGKVALLTSMPPDQIHRRLEANLADVPHASGFSNHMGSEFTSHSPSMEALIDSAERLRDRHPGLYFFDSHTSPHPVGPKIAAREGLPHLLNDLFLDNADNLNEMALQLDQTQAIAARRGSAIAIGHIQRKHMAAALKKAVPEFRKAGIEFVKLSDLLP